MPTNPVSPNSEAAVDRLNLSAADPRTGGSDPSAVAPWLNPGQCSCFESEPAGSYACNAFCSHCFEAE